MIKLSKDQEDLLILQRCRKCPWEFSKYVRTIDEADRKNPIKPFPYELAYIKATFKVLQNEKMLLVPKSRRMKLTWTCVVFFLWDTMFHEGVHSAVASKKEDDADWLLKNRFKFIYDHMDKKFPKHLLPKMVDKYCLLEFPETNSKIQGFPQGEGQMRMYTLSNIFSDELAFWDKAEGTYSAAKPTLEGGGRFVGISSPAPGFFKKMVFDRLDDDNLITESDTEKMNKTTIMEGLKYWRNQRNEFAVLEIHYRADPSKRSPEFKADAMRGISRKRYLQEYELHWETYQGSPVYTDFDKILHCSDQKADPHLGLPLLRGWDWGLTPACVVAQLQEGRLIVLKEFTAVNMGAERFSDQVIEECAIYFPGWSDQKEHWYDFIDPSGDFRKDTDETTCAQVIASKGLRPIPGAISWEKRRESVEKFLTKIYKGMPCIQINETECPMLVKGFQGGYRYPDSALELEMSKIKPVKDEHSHVHDALQMITSKIKMIKERVNREIPRQMYAFLKRA